MSLCVLMNQNIEQTILWDAASPEGAEGASCQASLHQQVSSSSMALFSKPPLQKYRWL